MLFSFVEGRAMQASVTWSPLDPRFYTDMVGTRSDAGPVIVPETMLTNAVAYRATNVLAHSVASIPLVVNRRLDNDGKERARDHLAYGILHDKPNPFQTSFRWRHLMMTHAIIWGDHYSELLPGPGGIGALVPLNPDTTRIVDQLRDGRLVYLTREKTEKGSGPERTILQDDLLHIRGFSIDGKRGIPLTKLARNAIGLALAAERHGALFMRRGAKFSGYLTAPQGMPDLDRKANEASWQKMQADGSGVTPLVTHGLEYKQMSVNNKESQWLEARTFQVEELLRFIGVPGVLCGYADKTSTYASAEQFFLSFVTHTVRPWTENIAQELNATVVIDSPNYFAEFVLEGLLKGDIKTRYAAHQMAIMSGWKNRNEVRIEESYNRGPDELDTYLEPMNMIGAGEEREPVAAPAPGGARRAPPRPADDDDEAEAVSRRAQLRAIATAAVSRVVQKEMTAISGTKGRKGAAQRFAGNAEGWTDWLAEFYEDHASAVVETLHVSPDDAKRYCDDQRRRCAGLDTLADFEATSTDRLLRLIPGD